MEIDGETVETVSDFIFLGSKIIADVHSRTQKKGAMTPPETDPDLTVSVQESPAEAWLGSGLLQDRGH